MEKVLIVDDDAQLLTIIKETLKRYRNKFSISTARDGLEAIRLLQGQSFSLVVTDLQMPQINGLVLLAYIAKNYSDIPCIIMTGHGTPTVKGLLEKEASHYLEKPFKMAELAQVILSVLDDQEIVRGTLSGISVVGFLRLIEMEMLTCLCEITTIDGDRGYFLINRGVLQNAYFGKWRAEEAALKLLKEKSVTIKFKKPPEANKIPNKIELDIAALLKKTLESEEEETLQKMHEGLAK
jgi:CheY-like chemotaxis protein